MGRATISAFIVCKDEEAKIERCLASLEWCDELVVVVDSASSDRTLEISQRYSPKVFVREWEGYVKQKQFALSQCTTDWVLNLDADEEVSPALRDEIKEVLDKPEPSINGYYLLRIVYFLGRYWNKGGWHPEYRLRLCRRTETRWEGEDPHDKAVISGNTRRLRGELYHFTYENFWDQVRRQNALSSNAALVMFKRGHRSRLIHFLVRPPARLIKFFIIKRGYREGMAGFLVGVIEAYYVYLKYLKLWELGQGMSHGDHKDKG